MKNAFRILSIATLTVGLLSGISSCGDDYDDSEVRDRLDNVENRVTQLEEWCATVNNDIASLKGLITALENNDYVTGVETLENGYRITFSRSGSITIHNGKDGADGEDGKDGLDGSTPIIGVAKYSDGLYYWTIQTEEGKMDWLTDADGNMIRTTGDNGKDGTDGEDGNDGNNAPTPIIKTGADLGSTYIADAVYISVDNGTTWAKISGDKGEQGIQGPTGDSFFKEIDISNQDYVIFTLQDGTPIEIAKWAAVNQEPVPTGIMILDCSSTTITKSDQIKVKLRINPSGFKVTKENIALDVWHSDTYFLDDGNGKTRASYVTPSDYYELVNIEPDKNEKNEELEGQWIATIQSKGDGNYRNLSELSFVVNYTDIRGENQQVSCLYAISVETIPTVDEGVTFSYSKAQTIYTTIQKDDKEETIVNPYIIFIDPNTYRNSQNNIWRYQWDFITQVDTQQNDSELTADIAHLHDGHYISFTPDLANEKWEGVTNNHVKKASSLIKIKLKDFANNDKELELPITYCPSNIELKLNLSAVEINEARKNKEFMMMVNIGEYLAEYGLTPEFMSNLSIRQLYGEQNSDMGAFPLIITDLILINGPLKDFDPAVDIWLSNTVTPGMSPSSDEISEISIYLSSAALESVDSFKLVSLKIKLPFEIVE